MKTQLNKILDIIKKYYLIVLGCLLFMLFIWFRFIRKRLPKEVPFTYLSFRGFIMLLLACCVYILIIKHLIKPSNKESIFSQHIVPLLYMPLESFDKFIKQPLNMEKIMFYMKDKLIYSIKDTHIFYILLAIVPRIILVTVLSIDIFWFGELCYIYFFIYLTIFLFFNRYIIYSFKTIKKQLINDIIPLINNGCITTDYVPGVHPDEDQDDDDYDPSVPTMSLPLEVFVDFQVRSIVYDNVKHYCDITLSDKHRDTFKNKEFTSNASLEKEYHWDLIKKEKDLNITPKIEGIVDIACLIEYYNNTNKTNTIFKVIKIAIFTMYLICWGYVLIRSLPKLDIMELITEINQTWLNIEEPFSAHKVYYIYNDFKTNTNVTSNI